MELRVGALDKAERASEGLAVIGVIVGRSSEGSTGGYNEIGRCVSLGPSETERLRGAGHRREKDRREDG
jgi:hypothetical protein